MRDNQKRGAIAQFPVPQHCCGHASIRQPISIKLVKFVVFIAFYH